VRWPLPVTPGAGEVVLKTACFFGSMNSFVVCAGLSLRSEGVPQGLLHLLKPRPLHVHAWVRVRVWVRVPSEGVGVWKG
jgi:hypothetical protein